mgnify:CR=1 FL=1
MFYGTECPSCHEMVPLVKKLEKELKVNVTQLEVWHNAKNAELFRKYDNGFCGGVPFFFNENNKKKICGAVPYEKLKDWAR